MAAGLTLRVMAGAGGQGTGMDATTGAPVWLHFSVGADTVVDLA